ncbi:parallel beta-helix repeat protein [Oxalobacteraceae bacterium GrIS 1.11]
MHLMKKMMPLLCSLLMLASLAVCAQEQERPHSHGATNATSVLDFGATPNDASDDTAAIQKAINASNKGIVTFPPGLYLVSANIILKAGVSLAGKSATITYQGPSATHTAFFATNGAAANDIDISGFRFDGKGIWTSTPFANPKGGGNSVGFTNDLHALSISDNSKNISIHDNTFTGLGKGVVIGAATQVRITKNQFNNTGAEAIYVNYASHVTVTENTILAVWGNMTAPGDVAVENSKFADGIYLHSLKFGTVENNVIENCTRIGIVLEGDGRTLNTHITINGNRISNMNSSRGTEYNAAIWSENGKSDHSNTAEGNVLNNIGAAAGRGSSRGIQGSYLTMKRNTIRGFSFGVLGTEFRLFDSMIENNSEGVSVASQAAGKSTEIIGNKIAKNNSVGVNVSLSHGMINIKNNTIEDNGLTATGVTQTGVYINRYYNDQKVVIASNMFISSANENPASGQRYAILSGAGGDFARTSANILNNQFLFTGKFTSAYPSNISIGPTSYAYDSTSAVTEYEIVPDQGQGNTNSKFAQSSTLNRAPGAPRMVGYASSAPASGTYRKGDYFINKGTAAGSYWAFICTTAGTPGSWQAIGPIAPQGGPNQ